MFCGQEVEVGLADRLGRVVQIKFIRERQIDPSEAALPILEVDQIGEIVHEGVEEMPFLVQRLFRPPALGDCAQGLDSERQVMAQLREKLHLPGIKSIRLLRVNRQGAQDLVIQKDR